MKKRLCFYLLFFIVIVLTGCDFLNSGTKKDDYEKLNELLAKEYSAYDITIDSKKGDLSLSSNYRWTKQSDGFKLNYRIEEYNELSMDSESELKKVKTGELVYKGSQVEVISGEDLGLSLNEIDLTNYSVSEFDYDSCEFTSTKFVGQIANAKFYLKSDVNCNNCTVEITFSSKAVSKIVITYAKDDGTNVTITYKIK